MVSATLATTLEQTLFAAAVKSVPKTAYSKIFTSVVETVFLTTAYSKKAETVAETVYFAFLTTTTAKTVNLTIVTMQIPMTLMSHGPADKSLSFKFQ